MPKKAVTKNKRSLWVGSGQITIRKAQKLCADKIPVNLRLQRMPLTRVVVIFHAPTVKS